jgi:ADP-heptose:LPS heptosyltransferase
VTKVRTDCRHYRVCVPCTQHKRTQVSCPDCGEYSPIDERIIVVKLDAMGDVLRTTTCLEPLKRLHPRSHITWITRTAAAVLLRGNPSIDRVLTVESNYLELLLCEEFDLALGPDADLLSASIMRLVHAGVKRGFVADGRGGVLPSNAAAGTWWQMGVDDVRKRENRRTYGEWLYAICELPGPIARPYLQPRASERKEALRFLAERAPKAARWVCFNTGASGKWREKRWKPAHYDELARTIRRTAPGTAVLLVGGPDEVQLNAGLLGADAGFIDGGTGNSIERFAALIASCDWIVTSDSLGYHVACAVGTPAVCLVGPTSPWELDLYGTNHVLHADLDCIACYLPQCPFTRTCMDELTPSAVWQHVPGKGSAPPVAGITSVPTAVRKSVIPLRPVMPMSGVGREPHLSRASANDAID